MGWEDADEDADVVVPAYAIIREKIKETWLDFGGTGTWIVWYSGCVCL